MLEINNISKIGVLSDTHIDTHSGSVLPVIKNHFNGVDLILHCGDIMTAGVLIDLETIAPVIAVKGNMDPQDMKLPNDETILINGIHTICMSHGSGSPYGIMQKLYKKFSHERPSLILFGHTHIAGEFELNGIRFFNPGSPTTRSQYYSLGMININNNELTTNVIVI